MRGWAMSGKPSARGQSLRATSTPRRWQALSEIGIQHEGRSKLADEFKGVDFDLVVTVCDSAAEECPVWLGKGKTRPSQFSRPRKDR